MDTCICMAESLHCSPETIITLFVKRLYPNTNLKVKKKKCLPIQVTPELTQTSTEGTFPRVMLTDFATSQQKWIRRHPPPPDRAWHPVLPHTFGAIGNLFWLLIQERSIWALLGTIGMFFFYSDSHKFGRRVLQRRENTHWHLWCRTVSPPRTKLSLSWTRRIRGVMQRRKVCWF